MSRVLIINDSRFESLILNDILSQMGYNVVITDEYNALKYLNDFAPSIVLANYIMKEVTGDRVIAAVKLKMPGVRCILTSSTDIQSEGIIHNGIDAIVKTPIDRLKLEEALNDKHQPIDHGKSTVDSFRTRLSNWEGKFQVADKELLKAELKKNTPAIEEEGSNSNKPHFAFCPYCGCKLA